MKRLQDIETNINPNYKDKIDESKDLYAFIDESGDEGFDFEKSTKWFNVSAIMIKPHIAKQMLNFLKKYKNKKYPTKKMHRLDSKHLKHNVKKDIFNTLNEYDFLTTHSIFYKPKIDPRDRLVTYPSMYYVGLKNVLERISWATKQFNFRRAHVLISNRCSIKKEDVSSYLFEKSISANKNLFYLNKIGIVSLVNFNKKNHLLLADYVAYTTRVALEEQGNPPKADPYYFNWLQKDKLFSSDHDIYSGVWSNGLKCTPNDKSLIQQSGILDEGSHKH